jgi:hypothetical protein
MFRNNENSRFHTINIVLFAGMPVPSLASFAKQHCFPTNICYIRVWSLFSGMPFFLNSSYHMLSKNFLFLLFVFLANFYSLILFC